MDTLIKNVMILPLPGKDFVIKNGYIGITDGKYSYVGTEEPEENAVEVIDGKNLAAMPGLINAHSHLAMTAFRGAADDLELQPWLFDHIFQLEEKLRDQDVRIATAAAVMECLATGTISVSDMYDHCETIAEVIDQSGMKANISRGITAFDPDFDFETSPKVQEMISLYQNWHGKDNGRIKAEAGIHAEYTSGPWFWEPIAAYAKENNLGLQVHISETKKEHDECVQKYGKTPVQILNQYGVFKVPVTAAHCVWITEDDQEILKSSRATIAHNPVSNLKLASGIAPVNTFLSCGINVALGTDSVASNNNHDLFEEIKASALLAKVVTGKASVLPAAKALEFATKGGAIAQRRENETGEIKPGMDADLILINLDAPHLYPLHSLCAQLAYSAKGSDVIRTMVRGKTLYNNGEFTTIDKEKVIYELNHDVIPHFFTEE